MVPVGEPRLGPVDVLVVVDSPTSSQWVPVSGSLQDASDP